MEKVRKNILNILKESENFNEEDAIGLTLEQYAEQVCNGEMDCDVSDTDIDMVVAFCYNTDESSGYDEMDKFLSILAKNVKIVKVIPSTYGDTLECDFSSFFKPYNEQLKEFFNMDYSEFDEDEAYYEAVVNLEPLISGNAGEQTYKELNDILTNKQSEPEVSQNDSGDNMNEAEDYNKNMESIIDEAARYLFDEGDADYLPDYEEFTEYTMEINRGLFDKAKEKALEALTKLSEHGYYDHENHGPTYLELNSNHTLWELEDDGMPFDDEGYTQIVQSAADEFEEETGTKLLFLGRSGRHVCVEPTYDNCMNFDYLQEVQEKLEKQVINDYNEMSKQWKAEQEKEPEQEQENMNESVNEEDINRLADLTIGDYEDAGNIDMLKSDFHRWTCVNGMIDNIGDNYAELEFMKKYNLSPEEKHDLATKLDDTIKNKLTESVDVNNLTKEQLWKLRQEIVLGSVYTDDYDNSFGIDPSAVCNFFDSFIEDAQTDDDGKPNNRESDDYDNADELYRYYCSCENPFGEIETMNESEENKYYIDLDLGFQYDINSLDELPEEADIRTDYKNIKCSIPKTNVLRIVGSKPTLERIIKNSDFDKDEDIPEIKPYNMNESEDVKRDLAIEPGSDEEATLDSLYDRKIKNYVCSYCHESIKNINDFDKKFYKGYGTEYTCPHCGEPYSFKDLKNIAEYEE